MRSQASLLKCNAGARVAVAAARCLTLPILGSVALGWSARLHTGWEVQGGTTNVQAGTPVDGSLSDGPPLAETAWRAGDRGVNGWRLMVGLVVCASGGAGASGRWGRAAGGAVSHEQRRCNTPHHAGETSAAAPCSERRVLVVPPVVLGAASACVSLVWPRVGAAIPGRDTRPCTARTHPHPATPPARLTL